MRLDQCIVQQELAASRTLAQKLITTGAVEVRIAGVWKAITKPSFQLEEPFHIRLISDKTPQYVSRAGEKLEGALKRTALSVRGLLALDVGQSTGGFTDCLLQADVDHVVGIDVGHDQLSAKIASHPKVTAYEGVNARSIEQGFFDRDAPNGFDLLVMDVSFISQTLILPCVSQFLRPGGKLVSLVKPQFEVGKDGIGKGGIVRDPALYHGVQNKMIHCAESAGFSILDYFESSIQGGDGNTEFFLYAEKS